MTTIDNAHTEPELEQREPVAVLRPASLAEARGQLAVTGTEVVAGGINHSLDRHHRRASRSSRFVAVAALPELGTITWTDDAVTIGAGMRLSQVATDERLAAAFPAVTEATGAVATGRIRKMVTLGGNIAARDERHDPPVALTALGATMTVLSENSTRTLDVASISDLHPDEIIQDIRIALLPGRRGSAFVKFLARGTWEYACVNVAAAIELADDDSVSQLSLAVGSVQGAPVLIDLDDLKGASVDDVIRRAAQRASETTVPSSDVKGSAEYKTRMIAAFSRRAISTAVERARQGDASGSAK